MCATRDDVDAVIADLLDSKTAPNLGALSLSPSASSATPIRSTGVSLNLAITDSPASPPATTRIRINATKGPTSPASATDDTESNLVLVPARTGKQGYHPFFQSLDPVVELAGKKLGAGGTIVVEVGLSEAQGEANDLAAALVLVLLGGSYYSVPSQNLADKYLTTQCASSTETVVSSRLRKSIPSEVNSLEVKELCKGC